MTNSYRSKIFYMWTVCACKCVPWAMPDGVSRCKRRHAIERLTVCLHIVLLSCVSIHAWCHLSPSPPLFLWSFPACQANKPNQALISGSMFTFYCALWHPLISLIPIWYQIIDTVGLLAKSGVLCAILHPGPLCQHSPVFLAHPLYSLSFSTAHSICMLWFCFMWVTSHKVNLWPFFANTLQGLFVVDQGLCIGFFWRRDEIPLSKSKQLPCCVGLINITVKQGKSNKHRIDFSK